MLGAFAHRHNWFTSHVKGQGVGIKLKGNFVLFSGVRECSSNSSYYVAVLFQLIELTLFFLTKIFLSFGRIFLKPSLSFEHSGQGEMVARSMASEPLAVQ